MSTAYQIADCAGIVPDPLQTLEPIASPTGPALKLGFHPIDLSRVGPRP